MKWLNRWFSFSWKKLVLVVALVPLMWFFHGNDFPRVDGFLRDAFQHLNSTTNINRTIVTINFNKKNEVFPRPLTFESILPVFEKIFKENPKKVIILLSPRELYHDEDKPHSTKKKLFDYLKNKNEAFLYATSDGSEDDVYEDKILNKFPRIFAYEMVPDKRWGPRDSKRRRVMISYDKQGQQENSIACGNSDLTLKTLSTSNTHGISGDRSKLI